MDTQITQELLCRDGASLIAQGCPVVDEEVMRLFEPLSAFRPQSKLAVSGQ